MTLTPHIDHVVNKAYKSLGFVLRSCKPFSDMAAIKSIYCAYVRSTLEYASQIWSPQYSIHKDRLERIQKKFIKYRQRISPDSYHSGCQHNGLLSLEERRVLLDMCLLFDTLNGQLDCADLVAGIGFCTPKRRTRHTPLLCTPKYSTRYASNNVLIRIARGCCGSMQKRTIVGGWAFAWWLVTDVQRISLEVMTLNPMCEMVETAQGVPLTVTGVAQCKIMNEDELLTTACEQFLGKTVREIKMTILQTLEGHLRAILGTLTVEEVYKDRDQFAGLVREVAAPDVGRMGIEILSFTIKDVYDDVQYLASLGKSQTAVVKRDADVGVAQANRDAGIREAECEKSAMDVKYSMDTRIEDNTRLFKLQKAQFDQEVNTAKAEAALAYELQAAKIKQKIRNEEIQIEVVERRKQIEVEQQEILRREEELVATVRLPAEAEAYRLQAIAEGKRTQTVEGAKADAERIKVLGLAEATAIGDVGKADAERMLAKAKVYKQYGDAAIMALVLEALPKIAAEVSAPLARTDEIVLVGDSGATGEVARLASGLPPAIKTLTGLDLTAVLKRLHPADGAGVNSAAAAPKKKEVTVC
ncbi:hypothetical protein evm_005096 [Chilo suppressalis]|nr:hypothetical protein evm_005096 [Chilo suppressalis]